MLSEDTEIVQACYSYLKCLLQHGYSFAWNWKNAEDLLKCPHDLTWVLDPVIQMWVVKLRCELLNLFLIDPCSILSEENMMALPCTPERYRNKKSFTCFHLLYEGHGSQPEVTLCASVCSFYLHSMSSRLGVLSVVLVTDVTIYTFSSSVFAVCNQWLQPFRWRAFSSGALLLKLQPWCPPPPALGSSPATLPLPSLRQPPLLVQSLLLYPHKIMHWCK